MKLWKVVSMNNILSDILEDIRNNRYKADEKLPSSNELASKYGVSRIIIRNIYEKLKNMGYIYSLQGRGYYVNKKREVIELNLGSESFTSQIEKQGYKLITKNIIFERIPFNEKIYNILECTSKDSIYKIGRLRIINNEACAIHISYLSDKQFPKIYDDGRNIESITKYYESKNIANIKSYDNMISVAFPTKKECEYLNCNELVPLIKLESIVKNEDNNKNIEYTEIFYRSDAFKYKL